MFLKNESTSVMRAVVTARVVNRLGGFSMGFLGVRLHADLGVSLSTVGLVLAAFGACTIGSRVLGGVLATRYGARRAMGVGLLGCAAAQGVIGLGSTPAAAIAGALALGLGYEVIEPATQALVAQQGDPARRASSYSQLWASLAVAGVVAGVIAALVAPWGIAVLFLVDAVTSVAAAIVVVVLLPDRPAVVERAPWRTAVTRRLLGWTLVATFYGTVVMVVVLLLPLAVERSGHPAQLTGWLLATAAVAAIAAQRLIARFETAVSSRAMLVVGYLVASAAFALLATGSLLGLLAGAALEGASGSVLLGTQQAVASRMAPPGHEAAVMTVYGLSWGVAAVVAPLVGTPLVEAGPSVLWSACAVASLVLATCHALARSRRRAPRRAASRLDRRAGRPDPDTVGR